MSIVRRFRAAAVVAAAAVGMSGCAAVGPSAPGEPPASVAQAEAPPAPGTWGAERADRRPVAKAPAALRACMTRNDGVVAWRSTEIMQQTRWRADGRDDAYMRVLRAVQEYMWEFRRQTGIRDDRDGFLGYDLDPANSRLIMQIDPTVLDRAAFRQMVDTAARKANRRAQVTRTPLTVTVQNGCFTAAEVSHMVKILYKNPRVTYLLGHSKLDGRLYAGFWGKENRAYARKLQQRYGPVLAIAVCGHVARGPATVRVEDRTPSI